MVEKEQVGLGTDLQGVLFEELEKGFDWLRQRKILSGGVSIAILGKSRVGEISRR